MKPTEEIWLPVVGHEGAYEVSNLGRLRSLDRVVETRIGPQRHKGKLLSPSTAPGGFYPLARLGRGAPRFLHQIVLEAFAGSRPSPKHQCRHLDGNPQNNRAANLAWGTVTENLLDAVRHGTHGQARKTHCKRGHELSPENTSVRLNPKTGGRHRQCRVCVRIGYARRKAKANRQAKTD